MADSDNDGGIDADDVLGVLSQAGLDDSYDGDGDLDVDAIVAGLGSLHSAESAGAAVRAEVQQ